MVTTGTHEPPTQTFRMSWLRLYAAMTSGVVVLLIMLFVLLLLLQIVTGGAFAPLNSFNIAAILLSGALFEAAFAIGIAALYPVRVGMRGIHSFNFWGVPGSIEWDDMAFVKPTAYAGLPWLVVQSRRTKNALWLPLFLTDNEAFGQAIVQFAPPNSPLLPLE